MYLFLLQFEKIKNDGEPLSRLSVTVKLLPENKKERSCRMSCFTAATKVGYFRVCPLGKTVF